jgi:glycosyltransferase involved in cell wall biosynthesis
MNITVYAPLPKDKHGVGRVVEELLKHFADTAEVEHIAVVAPYGQYFLSPALATNQKISLHPLTVLCRPLGLRKCIQIARNNFFKVFKLYAMSDIFLLLAMPTSEFHLLRLSRGGSVIIPCGGISAIYLLIKYGLLHSKVVQVLYDFIPCFFPEDDTGGAATAKLYDVYKNHFLHVPRKFIAISQATKDDAVRLWNAPADKVDVVYLGSFADYLTDRVNFGSNQVLTVSDISPRKNHLRLIQAFERVHRQCQQAELIIVGNVRKHVPGFDTTLRDIRQRNPNIKIQLRGHLSDEAVSLLYQEADVFVFPSLYEGFGLPVLEAMGCGCPVVTSNVSSLPEVTAGAALLVDPCDVEQMANALLILLSDDELKRDLSRRGIKRARQYSWNKTAKQLLQEFKEILNSK